MPEKKHAKLHKFILGPLLEDIGGIYINLLFNITIWFYHLISPNFMMIEPHKTHIFLSSGWAPLGFKHDLPVKLPKSPKLRGLEGPEPQLQGERPGHRCGQRRLERVQRPQRRPEVQQGASEAFFLQRFLGCNAGSYGSTFMCFLHIMFFPKLTVCWWLYYIRSRSIHWGLSESIMRIPNPHPPSNIFLTFLEVITFTTE